MNVNYIEKEFLSLLSKGIGHDLCPLPEKIDWDALEKLSEKQGLSAIVIDGIETLPEYKRPPKSVLLKWIGNTLQGFENRFLLYSRAIAELSSWYKTHGFKMMVLKGYGCSLNWPKPEHRLCGDIDIWLFGKCKEADAILIKEKKIKIDVSRQHHTVFYWRDFMVENHFDFLDVRHHKSNGKLEKILKELGKDDTHYVELFGEKVYMPSPNLHALFLLKHTMSHFAAEGITLRQILDWGFFVEKQGTMVDWSWLMEILDTYGMRKMFNIINAICVDDLGFNSSIFPQVQFNPITKERVLHDILFPEFTRSLPTRLFPRLAFKIRRWKANAWKHELCYKESMWSAFWSGVWNHMLKPASI